MAIHVDAEILVDGVPIALSIREWQECEHFGTLLHLEYRSVQEPPRAHPVSETGYRSHFVWKNAIEEFASPLAYAEAFGKAVAAEKRTEDPDPDQPSLF